MELVNEFERKRKRKFPGLLAHSPGSSSCHCVHCRYALSDLHEQVAIKCHMPCDKSLLVHPSQIVQGPGSLSEWSIERDVTLSLSARLVGGSGIPGRRFSPKYCQQRDSPFFPKTLLASSLTF